MQHTVHSGFSIVVKIRANMEQHVLQLLHEINNPTSNKYIHFDKIPSIHFVRGVVLPAQKYENEILLSTLVFATSYSGSTKVHLEELLQYGHAILCELFSYCEGFPTTTNITKKELFAYITKHRQWDVFYTGMQYLSKNDVLQQHNLRTYIQDFLQTNKNSFTHETATDIRKKIQQHIFQNPNYSWATKKPSIHILNFLVKYQVHIKTLITFLLLFFLVRIPFHNYILLKIVAAISITSLLLSITLIYIIRHYEKKDIDVADRPEDSIVKEVSNAQTFPLINTMSISGGLKKGKMRPLFFYVALKIVIFFKVFLNIPTVYTARWMTIDKGKRLVFLSNFTNFSESYVRDFIDNKKSASKINLLFGQGNGYPPTKWFFGRGAIENPTAFVYDVMKNHHITTLWYCPYQHIGIENIKNNCKIYKGLHGTKNEQETTDWLQLL